MSQSSPIINPELPKLQKQLQPIDAAEFSGDVPKEKLKTPLEGDRLSAANAAVSQAASNNPDPTSSDNTISLAQGDDAASVSTNTNDDLIADDVDVIEKVWVQKAKAVVDETKDDPHKQSVGLSHIKHDYLIKRFNKDLKSPSG